MDTTAIPKLFSPDRRGGSPNKIPRLGDESSADSQGNAKAAEFLAPTGA